MSRARYGIVKKIAQPHERLLAGVREARRAECFGAITEVDVRSIMKEKLSAELRPYIMLGDRNPPLAHQAISAELELGSLMPCNVGVWDNQDGPSTLAAVDVKTLFQLVQRPELAEVADTVRAKPARVADRAAALD